MRSREIGRNSPVRGANWWRRACAIALIAALGASSAQGAFLRDPWESRDRDEEKKSSLPSGREPGSKDADARKKRLAEEAKTVLAKPDADNAWTIALVVFRGDGAEDLARMALAKVRTEGGLPEAFMERRGDAVLVAYGRFESPDSPLATSEIKRIQEMDVRGTRPYRDALLTPPMQGTNLGGMPQINLTQARAMFGERALYTLQVAVYGRRDLLRPTEKDLQEARQKAELYAMQLRQQGEQAFYYHGPRMSMVTVGVFNEEDYDPQTPLYQSTRLKETKRRFPHNLYNGAGIREKRPGDREARLQPSTLVAIPEK